LICIHDSVLLDYTNLKYGHRSHAWFPVPLFDECFEVRRDEGDGSQAKVVDLLAHTDRTGPDLAINANRGGVWWFGRRGDGYVGLFSAKPNSQLQRTGRWADREIMCEDRVNVFICQVGSAERFGTFYDFMKACCSARIHVALGVYQPSRPFVDIGCSYDIPGKRNLWLTLEERWPVYDGAPLRDEAFPRWQNPWTSVAWRERSYTLSHVTPSGTRRTLDHDCRTGVRAGTGI
jgi:hypothetical protein